MVIIYLDIIITMDVSSICIILILYQKLSFSDCQSDFFPQFDNEMKGLSFTPPSVQIISTSLPTSGHFHIGLYLIVCDPSKPVDKATACAQLRQQILDTNVLLRRFSITVYIIDCIIIASPFPGSLGDMAGVQRVTETLRQKIGATLMTVYIDKGIPNRWQLNFNYSFTPCGPTYFHWNNLQHFAYEVTHYLAGNIVSKLFNSDKSVCMDCSATCYSELELRWDLIHSNHINCLQKNIMESYSTNLFDCFKSMPAHTAYPWCGNGVVEGDEECDCLISESDNCEDNHCVPETCISKPTNQVSGEVTFLTIILLILCAVAAIMFIILVYSIKSKQRRSRRPRQSPSFTFFKPKTATIQDDQLSDFHLGLSGFKHSTQPSQTGSRISFYGKHKSTSSTFSKAPKSTESTFYKIPKRIKSTLVESHKSKKSTFVKTPKSTESTYNRSKGSKGVKESKINSNKVKSVKSRTSVKGRGESKLVFDSKSLDRSSSLSKASKVRAVSKIKNLASKSIGKKW